MNKEVFITDAQFIEGFAGTFGQILSYYFFHDIVFKNKDKNLNIILGLSFLTTWLIRKIFMNLYNELKVNLNLGLFYTPSFLKFNKNNSQEDKAKNKKRFFFGILIFFICISLLGNFTASKPINRESIYIFIVFIVLYYLLIFESPERELKDHDMY